MTVPWETRSVARERLATEIGSVVRDWGGRIPTALLYPNSYFIGMSSLGIQAVYSLLNDDPEMVCERVFVDSPRHLNEKGLVSIESQRELWEFAIVALSLTYELDYWNALAALNAAAIPVLSSERDESHPIVIAGGPAVTANPEPMAPFVDAFVIGEAEAVLPSISSVLKGRIDADRTQVLAQLATIPGVYVPGFYSIGYSGDGTIERVTTTHPLATSPIRRQWATDLDSFETVSRVLTKDTEFGDMYLVEVSRGCGRQCRFCLAGYCFLPKRERSASSVLAAAAKGLEHRQRIGLVGSAVSDYSAIDEVTEGLTKMGARISVSSLRIDSLSRTLLRALVASGTRTLTLAPEVGSDRLSRVIGKGITRDQVIDSAIEAAKLGVKRFKLYYMIGLPTETDADVRDIIDLTSEVQRHVEDHQAGSHITVNVAPFVPKAHTPFERLPMCSQAELKARLTAVERGLRQKRVEVKGEGQAWSAVQGVLARGDRRVAAALRIMAGQPTLANWRRAMRETGLDEAFYLDRERAVDEILPWSVISTGVLDRYLQSMSQKAMAAIHTGGCGGSNCRRCGVC